MLVLTRQKGQKVVIEVDGVCLELTVIDVRGDKVRLGFAGPGDFKINRKEVYDAIVAENRSAATLAADVLQPKER